MIQLCSEISLRASSNCTLGGGFFICLFCFDIFLSGTFKKCYGSHGLFPATFCEQVEGSCRFSEDAISITPQRGFWQQHASVLCTLLENSIRMVTLA